MGDVQVNVAETAPSGATVYVSGDIDHRTTEQLRKALVDLIVRVKPHHLVINLDRVTAIDDQPSACCAPRSRSSAMPV